MPSPTEWERVRSDSEAGEGFLPPKAGLIKKAIYKMKRSG